MEIILHLLLKGMKTLKLLLPIIGLVVAVVGILYFFWKYFQTLVDDARIRRARSP